MVNKIHICSWKSARIFVKWVEEVGTILQEEWALVSIKIDNVYSFSVY